MKPVKFLFFVIVATVAACTKVDPVEENVIQGDFTFSANVEEQLTKTELNNEATGILWKANDEVMVYGSSANKKYTAQSSGASTILKGDAVGSAPFAAYYPADKVTAWDGDYLKFTASFPATQTYVEGNISGGVFPMIGYISEGNNFDFKNVSGVVCVKLKAAYDNIWVQSIKITAQDAAISGPATVAWNSGTPTVTMTGTAPADSVITLDCSDANSKKGVNINSNNYTQFYVVVPAGIYDNLKVTVTGSIQDKAYTASQTLTSSVQVTIERSKKTGFSITAANIVFDLSKQNGYDGETANTYLIKEPGKYKFPVNVKGNGKVPNGISMSSSIDTSSIKSSGIYYTDGTNPVEGSISVSNGYAVFSTAKTLAAGNALYGIFNANGNPADNVKGKCIWSWDIWANPNVRDTITTNGTDKYTFLTCHLGAHEPGLDTDGAGGYYGFYYQWGRKDPFPQYPAGHRLSLVESGVFVEDNSHQGTDLVGSISNPTHFYIYAEAVAKYMERDWLKPGQDSVLNLWDSDPLNIAHDNDNDEADSVNKTMFDPCPVGYHVPSAYVLSILKYSTSPWYASYFVWAYGFYGSYSLIIPAYGKRGHSDGVMGGFHSGNGAFFLWSAHSSETSKTYASHRGQDFYDYCKKEAMPIRPQKY